MSPLFGVPMPRRPLQIVSIVASLITEDLSTNDRSIMFGRFEMMEQAVAALKGKGDTEEHELSSSHPEVPNTSISVGMNPDLLVSFDLKSKLSGTGTHNCITCSHFVANQLCPQWYSRGREFVLNQNTVHKFGTGGCVVHNLLSELDDGQQMPNELFDQIVEKVLGEDICVIYKDGQITGELNHHDLGIEDPRKRTRHFEEYSTPEGEDEIQDY